MAYPRLFPRFGSQSIDVTDGWDLVVLGGDPMPGHAKVSSGEVKLKIDSKKASGKNDAALVLHGSETTDFDLTVTVWTDAQITVLDEIVTRLVRIMNDEPAKNAYEIDAPSIAMLNVTKVSVAGVTSLRDSSEIRGGKEMTIRLKKWSPAPPKKENKTTKTAAQRHIKNQALGNDNTGKKPDPATVPGTAGPTGEQHEIRETGRLPGF